jgi:hypothetical protein
MAGERNLSCYGQRFGSGAPGQKPYWARGMITPARPDRLRQVPGNDVSLERAWHELSSLRGRAAASTVEALMFALRERGIAALTEPKIRSWLSNCDDRQVAEVGDRLQKLKPEVLRVGKGKLHRGWTGEEVEGLLQTWSVLR